MKTLSNIFHIPNYFKLRRWQALMAWAATFALLAIALVLLWYAAHMVWWKWLPVHTTAFMRSDEIKLLAKHNNADNKAGNKVDSKVLIKHQWVDYSQISDHIKRAVITSEDANFEEHEGVDWEAIQKARARNTKRGKVVAGGSTITMQLAKNLFLTSQQSYSRKAKELVLTYMLETLWDKERILEVYLNSAEFGIGVFGVQAGAQHYFGVNAAHLSAEQAARMAAMLPRPKFYDKNRASAYLLSRTRSILQRMGGVQIP